MTKSINVAILGATGLIGETLLSILEERKFPINQLFVLASGKSSGQTVRFKGKTLRVQNASEFDFTQVQLAFFAVGSEQAAQYAPLAVEAGCLVIDNSAHFRLMESVPLVVPEVNKEAIADYRQRNIIANPNCSTIQMVIALKPILDAVGLKRINVATYQSVSGTGKKAISELAEQSAHLLNGMPIEPQVYPQQIAFNVLPHIDDFSDNGYTREEMKMILETQKILNCPQLAITATTVRVPVFYGHSEAIWIETERSITREEATALLKQAPGIVVVEADDSSDFPYPTPISHLNAEDAVYVGRIRSDLFSDCGLNLWVVADNVRKGGALNAVQIAEIWLNEC
ncbi:MAG: aspartate-semialdehyde dehydrogenase [Pseudomonadota bacterium]|jgi:aspartate-semialdehyde dehydrogenase